LICADNDCGKFNNYDEFGNSRDYDDFGND
jgi:hypothetical protein